MENILQTIKNWSLASNEDCQKVKEEIYKIVPEWSDEKLGCVLALDEKYVFYKDRY
jgi:hypothetical protein